MKIQFCIADTVFELNTPFDLDKRYFEKFETVNSTVDFRYDVIYDYKYLKNISERIKIEHNNFLYRYDSGIIKIGYCDEKENEYCALYNMGNNKKILSIPYENKDIYFMVPQIIEKFNMQSSLLKKDALILHSNYIIYSNNGILFTGLSGAGKSTQGSLWNKYQGAEVINGDRCVLKFVNGKLVAYGLPFCGSSNICQNKSSSVTAIVLVNKAEYNSVEKMTQKESFKTLLQQVAVNRWDSNDLNKSINIMSDIAKNVEFIKLNCQKNKKSTEVLKNYLKL